MRFARSALTAIVCGVLLAAGLGVAGTASADSRSATGRTSQPVTATVRIATLNTAATLKTRKAVRDVVDLAGTGADVLALQEMGSRIRRNAVTEALVDCSLCAYDAYMPGPAVEGSTPILFRWDTFRLVESGSRQVSPATYVGPRGAGPSTIRAKYVNFVKLRERATGRTLYVLNNHAVPTVQASSGGPNRRLPARLRLYRQHMNGLKALVSSFQADGSAVFVVGDLNVNYRKDRIVQARLFPFVKMGEVGLDASHAALGEPDLGTHVLPNGHDLRLIDYVFYPRHPAVEPLSQSVLTGYRSDHRPLTVDFRLTGD